MVRCFGFTDFKLITLVLAWWSQFSTFPGCAGYPGLFFINSLLLVPRRCLGLAFLLSKLFLIHPFAFISACIVGNIIFFRLTDPPKPHFIKAAVLLSLTVSLGHEFRKGEVLARHLSCGCRRGIGWIWEEGREQLAVGWLSLCDMSEQKLRDRKTCSV